MGPLMSVASPFWLTCTRHSGAPPPKMIPPIPHPEGPLEAYGRDAGVLTWSNIPPQRCWIKPRSTNLMKNKSDDRLVISNHDLMLFIPLSDPPNMPGIWDCCKTRSCKQTKQTSELSLGSGYFKSFRQKQQELKATWAVLDAGVEFPCLYHRRWLEGVGMLGKARLKHMTQED